MQNSQDVVRANNSSIQPRPLTPGLESLEGAAMCGPPMSRRFTGPQRQTHCSKMRANCRNCPFARFERGRGTAVADNAAPRTGFLSGAGVTRCPSPPCRHCRASDHKVCLHSWRLRSDASAPVRLRMLIGSQDLLRRDLNLALPLKARQPLRFHPQMRLASSLFPPGPGQCVSKLIWPLYPSCHSAAICPFQSIARVPSGPHLVS